MKTIKTILRKIFRIESIGTVVQLTDNVDAWGDKAGVKMVVTGYCRYFHRMGYRLDGNEKAIYLRGDFKVVQ